MTVEADDGGEPEQQISHGRWGASGRSEAGEIEMTKGGRRPCPAQGMNRLLDEKARSFARSRDPVALRHG